MAPNGFIKKNHFTNIIYPEYHTQQVENLIVKVIVVKNIENKNNVIFVKNIYEIDDVDFIIFYHIIYNGKNLRFLFLLSIIF